MKLVFSNDDFGLSFGFNEAIKDSFIKGTTTSTSILANGKAYNNAVEIYKNHLKDIGIGIHLNLTDGKANVPELSDSYGDFNNTFLSLYHKIRSKSSLLKPIKIEFKKQIEKALNSGLPIDHIDSDKHIHMIPPIFEVTCLCAKEFNIKHVRLTRENIYSVKPIRECFTFQTIENIPKLIILNSFSKINFNTAIKHSISVPDAFYGVLYTNEMTDNKIISALENAKRRSYNTVEILSHPGYIDDARDTSSISPLMYKYSKLQARESEAKTTKSKKIFNYLKDNKIERVNFKQIS